jgi:hypothetical protein
MYERYLAVVHMERCQTHHAWSHRLMPFAIAIAIKAIQITQRTLRRDVADATG